MALGNKAAQALAKSLTTLFKTDDIETIVRTVEAMDLYLKTPPCGIVVVFHPMMQGMVLSEAVGVPKPLTPETCMRLASVLSQAAAYYNETAMQLTKQQAAQEAMEKAAKPTDEQPKIEE